MATSFGNHGGPYGGQGRPLQGTAPPWFVPMCYHCQHMAGLSGAPPPYTHLSPGGNRTSNDFGNSTAQLHQLYGGGQAHFNGPFTSAGGATSQQKPSMSNESYQWQSSVSAFDNLRTLPYGGQSAPSNLSEGASQNARLAQREEMNAQRQQWMRTRYGENATEPKGNPADWWIEEGYEEWAPKAQHIHGPYEPNKYANHRGQANTFSALPYGGPDACSNISQGASFPDGFGELPQPDEEFIAWRNRQSQNRRQMNEDRAKWENRMKQELAMQHNGPTGPAPNEWWQEEGCKHPGRLDREQKFPQEMPERSGSISGCWVPRAPSTVGSMGSGGRGSYGCKFS